MGRSHTYRFSFATVRSSFPRRMMSRVVRVCEHRRHGSVGALGTLLYLPAKFKLRVLDPVLFDVPPNQERYSKSRIMDEAESIRVSLQETLYEMLRTRRSVWFG